MKDQGRFYYEKRVRDEKSFVVQEILGVRNFSDFEQKSIFLVKYFGEQVWEW